MAYEEIRAAHPVARKDYRCEWCAQTISKGEKHLHRVYRFEGDFNDGRMHLECEVAMDKSPWDEVADGWVAGEPQRGVTLDGKKVVA